MVGLRIREEHNHISNLQDVVPNLEGELRRRMSDREFRRLKREVTNCVRQSSSNTIEKHRQKLDRWCNNRRSDTGQSETRWVKNLSQVNLSVPQLSVLRKGLNFAVAPAKVPVADIVASVESGIQSLNEQDKSDICGKVISIIKASRPPKANITRQEREALKSLRENEDILVLPADKGRVTVVVDKREYDAAIVSMISNTTTYMELRSDPAASRERALNAKLLNLKRQEKLDNNLYRRLRSSGGSTPRFYGLPKIHKNKVPVPYRPIVSFINSPTYDLSKYLSELLSPLVGRTEAHVNNSREVADFLRTVKLAEDETQFSLDVEALFTSVPVNLAVQAANERLSADGSLGEGTSLGPGDICDLLEFCLGSTEFTFRGRFYRQIFGTAMGSPVSVTIANLTMETIEEQALRTFIHGPPRIYRRYVDDTYVVMKRALVEAFHQHINAVNQHINFTIEMPADEHLAFLDLDLKREVDGSMTVAVYRETCHTDQYLRYDSHHPVKQRHGTVSTLLHRAWTLPSTQEKKIEEVRKVRTALKNNGYPDRVVSKVNRAVRQKIRRGRPSGHETAPEVKGWVTLPYVSGTSERLARVLTAFGVKVAQKPVKKLRDMLVHPKDPLDKMKKQGTVYQLECADCGARYVGETGRDLATRIQEHKRAVRLLQPEKSAVAEHVLSTHHEIKWTEVVVVSQEKTWRQRRWKEAIAIKSSGATLNRDDGLILPGQYNCLF